MGIEIKDGKFKDIYIGDFHYWGFAMWAESTSLWLIFKKVKHGLSAAYIPIDPAAVDDHGIRQTVEREQTVAITD